MFSLFELQPDPGFKNALHCQSWREVFPGKFVFSSWINMNRSNVRLRVCNAGIPIQSFVCTGDPSCPQHALPSFSRSPSPLAKTGPFPDAIACCSSPFLLLPAGQIWTVLQGTNIAEGQGMLVWRVITLGLVGGYSSILIWYNQQFSNFPCALGSRSCW